MLFCLDRLLQFVYPFFEKIENIDFDASPVLRGEETIEECGRRLFHEIIEVADGKLTKAEQLGHAVFAIGKIAV